MTLSRIERNTRLERNSMSRSDQWSTTTKATCVIATMMTATAASASSATRLVRNRHSDATTEVDFGGRAGLATGALIGSAPRRSTAASQQ